MPPVRQAARASDIRHVVIFEVNESALGMIGLERTARAALALIPQPHEMVNDQLGVAAKQLCQRLLSLSRVEDVLLLDLDPGQSAALGAHQIAHTGERLLVLQMRFARSQPFITGYDLVRLHDGPSDLQLSGA